MKFTDLPLHPTVMQGIERAEFVECMPVQEKVLPIVLDGKDVMVQSKTGSGKTAVFLLAILQKFVSVQNQDVSVKSPVAAIVAPTRELAVQIEDDARILSSGIKNFRIGCFYGGVGYVKQDKQIYEGLDLIIGTPGRLLDYQKMGKINFKTIDTFVLDEADRMFDMGFYPDIQKMFSYMVSRDRRQTMLFSATLGTRVRNLAWAHMNSPAEIEVQPEEITVKEITQELYHVSKEDKFVLFLRLIAKENPPHALVFTNTKAKAVELAKRLAVNGYQSQYLMGDLPQSKRLAVISRMKRGELRFLVATDVAARGLQIDDLELVVNYDIPEDFESYVHRIGRTARAGKSGKAITLACEQFVYGLEAIEQYIQMKIPVVWPTEDELPLVIDKSAAMRFRDLVGEREYASRPVGGKRGPARKKSAAGQLSGARRPKTGKPQAPARQKSVSVQPQAAPVRQKPVASETRHRKGRLSYEEVQKLSFEQRMAYYKQAYGNEDSPKKQEAATAVKSRVVPKVKSQVPAHQESPKPVEQPSAQPQKKAGLLQRLLGKLNRHA
jgi:ATP-dependent RNA helicase RhlB